jgi:hypothetical protein
MTSFSSRLRRLNRGSHDDSSSGNILDVTPTEQHSHKSQQQLSRGNSRQSTHSTDRAGNRVEQPDRGRGLASVASGMSVTSRRSRSKSLGRLRMGGSSRGGGGDWQRDQDDEDEHHDPREVASHHEGQRQGPPPPHYAGGVAIGGDNTVSSYSFLNGIRSSHSEMSKGNSTITTTHPGSPGTAAEGGPRSSERGRAVVPATERKRRGLSVGRRSSSHSTNGNDRSTASSSSKSSVAGSAGGAELVSVSASAEGDPESGGKGANGGASLGGEMAMLITVKDLWSNDIQVVNKALFDLAFLTSGDPKVSRNRRAICRMGGHLAAVKAIETHAERKISDNGLTLLQNMAIEAEVRSSIVELGGIEVAVSEMRKFAHDPGVQRSGCGLLMNLCAHSDEAKLKIVFGEGNAVAQMVDAMKLWVQDEKLQLFACTALRNLSDCKLESDDIKEHIYDVGALGALATAVENHRAHPKIPKRAVDALKRWL